MKPQTTGLILTLCFFGTALCFAGDPQLATTKLDESKSKAAPETEKVKPTHQFGEIHREGHSRHQADHPAVRRLGRQGSVDGSHYQADVLDAG